MKTGKIIIGVLSIIIGIVTLIESNDVYRLASAFGVNGFHIYVGFIVGFIFIGVGVSSLLMMDKQSKLYAETTLSLSSVAFFLCFRGPELFTDLLFFAIWSAICFVFAIFAYYGTKKHDGNGKYDQLATNQLTCPYCSAVVDEGTVFCGSCGKKIKRNCPQCSAELNTSDVFCPNCGIQLNENNTVVSFAAAEPQQGIDFNDDSSFNNNRGNLYIRWDGKWALIDYKVQIWVNGIKQGEYSFKDGFEVVVPIYSPEMVVETKLSFHKTKKVLSLNPQKNYSYNLIYNTVSGSFGLVLCDNDGNELETDKLHWGYFWLYILIPIVGFIYAFSIRKKKPATSYQALMVSLLGFAVSLILSYSMPAAISRYNQIKEEKLAREKFVADSLEKVRQDSINLAAKLEAERIEKEKIERFRENFTFNNILNLLKHPDDASLAQKCGLSLLYKNSETIVDNFMEEGDSYKAYDIAYGYETEKGSKNSEGLGYGIKASSTHSCYFNYLAGRGKTTLFHFKDESDADYLFEMAKDHGLIECCNRYFIPRKKVAKGITHVEEYDPESEALYGITQLGEMDGWYSLEIGMIGSE